LYTISSGFLEEVKGLSEMQGLIHIYTGDGKGKTTAALGLSIRAYGRGLKVALFQFLKGTDTGELRVLSMLDDGRYRIYRNQEITKFVKDMSPAELQQTQASIQKLWDQAKKIGVAGDCDLLILDEIMAVVSLGLIPLEKLVKWLQHKPESLEVVLTGRNAPEELIALADYVSEIKAIKHPYEKGVTARKGIEF